MSVKVAGMTRTVFSAFLSFCLLLPLAPRAGAWGPLGHRLVARLAEADLDPRARAEIQRLLRGEAEPTLAGIANWADDLRENDPDLGKATARWHYVNIGEHDCSYQPARDCPDGKCVVEAIRAQSAILADPRRPDAERLQALKFVVHFVGDAHQPLHAGYARDKGGNDFQTSYQGKGGNLHRVWDSGLLNSRGLNEDGYLRVLRALPLPAPDRAAALPPASADWARQSCAIAVAPGFYPDRAKLETAYYEQQRPIAERQLRLGGARLASLLNAALAPH